jgi:hypothetical protein
MESLDFVIDIAENLKKQKIDYFIIAVRNGKFANKVDIFQSIENPLSAMAILQVINKIKAEFEQGKKKGKKSKKQKPNSDEDNI